MCITDAGSLSPTAMYVAQCAAEVLGGACGAVAGTLLPGIAVLPSESAAATNLPEQVVRCVLEILVKYRFAERDEIGYVAAELPPALIKLYVEHRDALC